MRLPWPRRRPADTESPWFDEFWGAAAHPADRSDADARTDAEGRGSDLHLDREPEELAADEWEIRLARQDRAHLLALAHEEQAREAREVLDGLERARAGRERPRHDRGVPGSRARRAYARRSA